jgi:hypothetical protein
VRKRFRVGFVVFGIVTIYLDVYYDYLYALLIKGRKNAFFLLLYIDVI